MPSWEESGKESVKKGREHSGQRHQRMQRPSDGNDLGVFWNRGKGTHRATDAGQGGQREKWASGRGQRVGRGLDRAEGRWAGPEGGASLCAKGGAHGRGFSSQVRLGFITREIGNFWDFRLRE